MFIYDWLDGLSQILSDNLWIGLLIALLAGVLSSFTPCALSSMPLVIGYVGGSTDNRKKAFFYSLIFVLGMTVVFTVFGVIAVFVGKLFYGIQMYWYIFLAVLMIVMALQTWGVINILPNKCGYKTTSKRGIIGAFLTGMLGALFASPCSTPVLIAIMAVVSTGQSIVMGVLMLLLYSLGHGVLILVAGTSTGLVNDMLKSPKFEKASGVIKIILGILFLLIALYLLYAAFS